MSVRSRPRERHGGAIDRIGVRNSTAAANAPSNVSPADGQCGRRERGRSVSALRLIDLSLSGTPAASNVAISVETGIAAAAENVIASAAPGPSPIASELEQRSLAEVVEQRVPESAEQCDASR